MGKQRISLTGAQSSVTFANGTFLELPNYSREVTQFTNDGKGVRSAQLPADVDTSPWFERALQEAAIHEQETIHLNVAVAPPQVRAGGPSPADDRVTIRPSPPPAGSEQVVLYQDESGGLSWHFAQVERSAKTSAATMRRSGLRQPGKDKSAVFVIPLRTQTAQQSFQQTRQTVSFRGLITKVGRKVFKIFVIPIAASLLDKPVEKIGGAIERKHRQNLIWLPPPDTYTKPPDASFADWKSLASGPALLIVHGIFSSVEGMLSKLPQFFMSELHSKYGGRVIAYNHLSVTETPDENASWFLQQLKQAAPQSRFTFDVLCHSRGGIVSRALAERGPTLVPETNCDIRKVFFVATPNQGSALGDPAHIVDMIDVFTNLLTNFPDGPVMYSIETVLAIVKLLAYTAETSLPGLAAMGTETYIKQILNASGTPATARYGAAAADYHPDPRADNGFLTGPFVTNIIDRVFRTDQGDTSNDLVVPEQGVYARNGHPSFPIANPLVFGSGDRVWHSDFFSRDQTIRKIRDFLEMPALDSVRQQRLQQQQQQQDAYDYDRPGRVDRFRSVRRPGLSRAPSVVQEAPIERNPFIEFTNEITEGEAKPLAVWLEQVLGEVTGRAMSLPLAPGQDHVNLTVRISAPGFEVIGEAAQSMTVRRVYDAKAERAVFQLKAKAPGVQLAAKTIRADFWLDHHPVGSASVITIIKPKDFNGDVPPQKQGNPMPMRISPELREDCDLLILVGRDSRDKGETYEIKLSSHVPGRTYQFKSAGAFDLSGTNLANYLSDLIEPKFQSYPQDDPQFTDGQFEVALQAWSSQFIKWLRDIGKRLWQFLPEEFRAEYLALQKTKYPPRSIFIHSDEMVFPWELVVPWSVEGEYTELPALGAAHVLGRWQPGLSLRPEPQKFPIKKLLIVNPVYDQNQLPWSAAEVTALQQMISGSEVLSPADLQAFEAALNRSDLQMIHFSGHGEYDAGRNADLNALLLEKKYGSSGDKPDRQSVRRCRAPHSVSERLQRWPRRHGGRPRGRICCKLSGFWLERSDRALLAH